MQVEDTCIKLRVSITGENKHYGTPTNLSIATQMPRGSSSGVVSTVGVVPMTQSVDTIGWSARDSNILCHVGHVLLQLPLSDFRQRRCILVADDYFQLLRIPEKKKLGMVISSVENIQGQVLNHINLGQYIASKVPSLKFFKNGEGNYTLKNICDVFPLLQRYEFKMNQEE